MHILVILGPRAAGKTSLCMSVFHAAQTHDFICQGCIEISERGDDMVPYRVQLLDLASGDIFLAAERPRDRRDIPFEFYSESFARVRKNFILFHSLTCKRVDATSVQPKRLCIIDEIGPLELEQNTGHFELLKLALDSESFDALVLTVRSALRESLINFLEKQGISLHDLQLLEIGKQPFMSAQRVASLFIETI